MTKARTEGRTIVFVVESGLSQRQLLMEYLPACAPDTVADAPLSTAGDCILATSFFVAGINLHYAEVIKSLYVAVD